jgi:Fe-S cluster biogenesis protein NfuA
MNVPHRQYAMCDYNQSESSLYKLGDVVAKDGEVGVIIQIHEEHEFRVNMWGNCSSCEIQMATAEQLENFNPQKGIFKTK